MKNMLASKIIDELLDLFPDEKIKFLNKNEMKLRSKL